MLDLEKGSGVADAVGVDDDDGRIFLSLGRVRDPRRHVNMSSCWVRHVTKDSL